MLFKRIVSLIGYDSATFMLELLILKLSMASWNAISMIDGISCHGCSHSLTLFLPTHTKQRSL